jgi:hypothetical protein
MMDGSNQSTTYTIKLGNQTFQVQISSHDATLSGLQSAIEAATGVLVRQQKLLCKGKVIAVPNDAQRSPATLAAVGITPGEKIMLLATPSAMMRSDHSISRGGAQRQRGKHTSSVSTKEPCKYTTDDTSIKQRTAAWKRTGIVGLRDLKLSDIPADVFETGEVVRVLDCGNNQLTTISSSPFSKLLGLEKLRLSFNALTDDGVPWAELAALPRLAVLTLDHNRLTSLPATCLSTHCLGPHLLKLALDHNKLTSLPDSISCLTSLKALSVASNQLTELPSGLSQCTALEELDASSNPIHSLPIQWSDAEYKGFQKLEILALDATLIDTLPSAIFQTPSLRRLSLHGAPISLDQLASIPGYDAYEARRQAVTNKQHDLKVLKDREGGYDAGADSQEWERWRSRP